MSSIDERIAKSIERTEQLKHQKKAQEAREKKRRIAIDKERQIIIGKTVAEFFPEVLCLHPSRNNAENQIEFAPLVNFMSELASDKELIERLKDRVSQRSNLPKRHV